MCNAIGEENAKLLLSKACRVRGIDNRGLPKTILLEARSKFEAAAKGLELLNQEGAALGDVEVTVCEPAASYGVTLAQLAKWAAGREVGDTIGVTALKSRIRNILQKL